MYTGEQPSMNRETRQVEEALCAREPSQLANRSAGEGNFCTPHRISDHHPPTCPPATPTVTVAGVVLRRSCDSCVKLKRACNGESPCHLCARTGKCCKRSPRKRSGPPKGTKYQTRTRAAAAATAADTATATADVKIPSTPFVLSGVCSKDGEKVVTEKQQDLSAGERTSSSSRGAGASQQDEQMVHEVGGTDSPGDQSFSPPTAAQAPAEHQPLSAPTHVATGDQVEDDARLLLRMTALPPKRPSSCTPRTIVQHQATGQATEPVASKRLQEPRLPSLYDLGAVSTPPTAFNSSRSNSTICEQDPQLPPVHRLQQFDYPSMRATGTPTETTTTHVVGGGRGFHPGVVVSVGQSGAFFTGRGSSVIPSLRRDVSASFLSRSHSHYISNDTSSLSQRPRSGHAVGVTTAWGQGWRTASPASSRVFDPCTQNYMPPSPRGYFIEGKARACVGGGGRTGAGGLSSSKWAPRVSAQAGSGAWYHYRNSVDPGFLGAPVGSAAAAAAARFRARSTMSVRFVS